MSDKESTALHSSKVGKIIIPYSDLEKMDARTCQNCYHPYKDHTNESGEIIPCMSCEENDRCENFRESL